MRLAACGKFVANSLNWDEICGAKSQAACEHAEKCESHEGEAKFVGNSQAYGDPASRSIQQHREKNRAEGKENEIGEMPYRQQAHRERCCRGEPKRKLAPIAMAGLGFLHASSFHAPQRCRAGDEPSP